MAGWLTQPEAAKRNELQILLHGASYDHRYWDWPFAPQNYSYVRFATENHCATLAVDRIGSGMSSRPPGRENTMRAQARALSHLVEAARTGGLAAHAFDRVVLVGHSLGSILAGAEAAWYADVDAVVMTGHLGVDSGAKNNDARLDAGFRPVAQDPAVGHLTGLVDDAYLTPNPEHRVPMFYVPANADPEVIALDERIKGVITLAEVSDMGTAADAGESIRVPTLAMLGELDAMQFDPATEKSTYEAVKRATPQAPTCFEYVVLAGVGHNINLHRDAPVAYRMIGEWLDSVSEGSP
ncbi:alpha/beta hydrolase [Streptomyces sp. NPDC056656]|uniref:alpha/beta hydrolase n=1 Tax=Streptomyces sp. NPDC056656 TaxID=3345895 RepID=UPI0036772839